MDISFLVERVKEKRQVFNALGSAREFFEKLQEYLARVKPQ